VSKHPSSGGGSRAFETIDQTPVPAAQLVLVAGRETGRKYLLTLPAVIGRDPTGVVHIDDTEVSRRHARIFERDEQVVIEDLGSRNGTFVGDLPVDKPMPLKYGDRIALGSRVRLVYTRWDPQQDQALQRERLETLGKLAAAVAHDLNNSLCGAITTVEYLCHVERHKTLADGEVRECLGDLLITLREAADLAPRVLDLARSTPGRDSSVDVGRLCRDVAAVAKRTVGPHIEVTTEVEPDLLVRGSQAELHHALVNLCVNARDAMPNGGRLHIAAARDRSDRVSITVRDTGMGMDAATRARIFEPFFTTKNTPAAASGVGLGLSRVLEIVRAHGGDIVVASDVGRGASFVVHLPLFQARPFDTNPPADDLGPANANATVLLVDDSLAVRRSAARILRAAGYTVEVLLRGRDTLERLRRDPPIDLVVLDEVLPDMRGREVLAELGRLGLPVRVLRVSGTVPLEGRHTLTKPWTTEVLLTAVRHALADPADAPIDDLADRVTSPDLLRLLGRSPPKR
jgi:signal transduction histidine kinase/CheY-like chemotaxis protein